MRRPNKEQLVKALYVTVLILFVSTIAAVIGRQERKLTGSPAAEPSSVTAVNTRKSTGDWAKIELILNTVTEKYVDSLNRKDITERILPAIMAELDPHSVYLPPEDLKDADEMLQGEFYGIGIMFTVPEDTAIVNSVIVGGPSEKAGLQPGDRIIAVDTVPIAGVNMPQNDMVRKMRGKKGTKVRLDILREGDTVTFDIKRDRISEKSVDVAFMMNDTTGYVKLSKFSRSSYSEFRKAVDRLRGEGMRKLIFDLRDNGGGFMDQAILMSNEFFDKGTLMVYVEGAHYSREDIHADGRGSCMDLELAVLVNENSASSSEIFAGAIQDNDRGTIYGLRTFGKGLVQEPMYFSDGSGIRLTVARYHTPSGRCIQKPYGDDYGFDIYQRYHSGEMISADSIKVNDSLKFSTAAGRTVYGGGGIIPDVFVPIDTTGYTDFLGLCNRKGLQFKFAYQLCDSRRRESRAVLTMDDLDRWVAGMNLREEFTAFAGKNGVAVKPGEWEISGGIILTQLKAMIARYTPLDDSGFYPIWLTLDSTVQRALENR